MEDKILKFSLRIPEQVLNNIRVLAQEDGRSLNKEIEYILKQYAIDRGFFGEDTLNIKSQK